MTRRILLALLVVVLGLGAYGTYHYVNRDTQHDVVMRHAGQFTAIRHQLDDLAQLVPAPVKGDLTNTCSGIGGDERPFRYDASDPAHSNTGMVTYDQLSNPATSLGTWDFISPGLAPAVAEAAPGYRTEAADSQVASDWTRRTVEATAEVRYVVVVQTHLLNPEGDGRESAAGTLDDVLEFGAVIADLRSHRVLCTVAGGGAIPSTGVLYRTSPRDGAAEREREAKAAADDRLRTEAERSLERALDALGRGHFDLG